MGSAYWIAREGLAAFLRMSDWRAPEGALHALLVRDLGLAHDLDLAGRINNLAGEERSKIAQLSKLVASAVAAGDRSAEVVYERAARELASLVEATATHSRFLRRRPWALWELPSGR